MEKTKGFLAKLWFWLKNFALRSPWWTTLIVITVLIGGFWYYQKSTSKEEILSAEVKRGTVSQVVSVTGLVKPANEVNLSFEKGGKVSGVFKKVGDRVLAGESLISLSAGEIIAQLDQAKATVKAEEARLLEIKKGTRPEDIVVSQVAVDNAKNDIVNSIKNAYVNADDAIYNKVDQFFSNPKSQSPQLNFILADTQLKNNIENDRLLTGEILIAWTISISGLNVSSPNLSEKITEGKNNLRSIQSYLDKVALAINSLTPTYNISQTTIDSYKASVLAGRSNVIAALNTLTAAEEKLNNAISALALKQAGSTPEKILAQEAVLEGAMASVKNLEAQIAKTVIYSPISGVVTKQEAKVGEVASVGITIVSVISEAKFGIEANVPEADIAKIKTGDEAEITLDAYGSDTYFLATVSRIDPAETVIDGVSTYKTTLQFKNGDKRIKSGMTANIDIYGEKRNNVLYIPARTIITRDSVKIANLVEGETVREVIITTGLRGSDGNIEIISGLKEGDRVKM